MDPIGLAATIVGSFLVPFVKEGARKLGQALSGETDSATANQMVETSQALWERVKASFSEPDDTNALQLFERYPEDMRPLVERKLRERLEADERLRTELASLVERPTPDGSSTGAQIMHAHTAVVIDNRGATVSGGRIIGVNVVESPRQEPRPGSD